MPDARVRQVPRVQPRLSPAKTPYLVVDISARETRRGAVSPAARPSPSGSCAIEAPARVSSSPSLARSATLDARSPSVGRAHLARAPCRAWTRPRRLGALSAPSPLRARRFPIETATIRVVVSQRTSLRRAHRLPSRASLAPLSRVERLLEYLEIDLRNRVDAKLGRYEHAGRLDLPVYHATNATAGAYSPVRSRVAKSRSPSRALTALSDGRGTALGRATWGPSPRSSPRALFATPSAREAALRALRRGPGGSSSRVATLRRVFAVYARADEDDDAAWTTAASRPSRVARASRPTVSEPEWFRFARDFNLIRATNRSDRARVESGALARRDVADAFQDALLGDDDDDDVAETLSTAASTRTKNRFEHSGDSSSPERHRPRRVLTFEGFERALLSCAARDARDFDAREPPLERSGRTTPRCPLGGVFTPLRRPRPLRPTRRRRPRRRQKQRPRDVERFGKPSRPSEGRVARRFPGRAHERPPPLRLRPRPTRVPVQGAPLSRRAESARVRPDASDAVLPRRGPPRALPLGHGRHGEPPRARGRARASSLGNARWSPAERRRWRESTRAREARREGQRRAGQRADGAFAACASFRGRGEPRTDASRWGSRRRRGRTRGTFCARPRARFFSERRRGRRGTRRSERRRGRRGVYRRVGAETLAAGIGRTCTRAIATARACATC